MAYYTNPTRAFSGHQQGMILITVLVVLTALTLLVISALSTSALEYRMSHNNLQQLQAFVNAESQLQIAAAQIKQGHFTSASDYQIERLSEKKCPATACFKVLAFGQYKQAEVTLFAQYDLSINSKLKQPRIRRVVWGFR